MLFTVHGFLFFSLFFSSPALVLSGTNTKADAMGMTSVFNASGVDSPQFRKHIAENPATYEEWSAGEWKQETTGKENHLNSPYLQKVSGGEEETGTGGGRGGGGERGWVWGGGVRGGGGGGGGFGWGVGGGGGGGQWAWAGGICA